MLELDLDSRTSNEKAAGKANSSRLVWVDIAKGLASIFVITVHATKPDLVSHLIVPYFLAVFFFVSGYSMKIPFQTGYVKKMVVKTLKDMLVYGVPVILLTRIFQNTLYLPYLINDFIGIVIQFPVLRAQYLDYLWFLSCILLAKLIFIASIKVAKGRDLGILCLSTLIGGLGCLYSDFVHFPLPWHIQTACAVQLLYCAGYFFRKYEDVFAKYETAVFAISGFAFIISIVKFPTDADIHTLVFTSYHRYIIQMILGLSFFICICRNIKQNKVLQNIGVNSVFFYAFGPTMVLFTEPLFSEYTKQMDPYFASFFITLINVLLVYLACELYLQIKAEWKRRKGTAKITV